MGLRSASAPPEPRCPVNKPPNGSSPSRRRACSSWDSAATGGSPTTPEARFSLFTVTSVNYPLLPSNHNCSPPIPSGSVSIFAQQLLITTRIVQQLITTGLPPRYGPPENENLKWGKCNKWST
ncbi:MAG: hypothetical protein BJ554DRAFT_3876 [Olpidium bornovanus]|uniref:Uncharacterized protein n=1 Tax=Olpidium bornovanus TaxID=278681 RepID=A0A8H8A0K2_9FUNG|nr:MAG: hypothetical protein BJ554DRAFT_3876 [Olpidium bornovanus]